MLTIHDFNFTDMSIERDGRNIVVNTDIRISVSITIDYSDRQVITATIPAGTVLVAVPIPRVFKPITIGMDMTYLYAISMWQQCVYSNGGNGILNRMLTDRIVSKLIRKYAANPVLGLASLPVMDLFYGWGIKWTIADEAIDDMSLKIDYEW